MDKRGRQRDPKRNPSRESLVDKQMTDVIAKKSLILGDIERVQAKINNCLDSYSEESNDTLRELSKELSTLTASLEKLEDTLT